MCKKIFFPFMIQIIMNKIKNWKYTINKFIKKYILKEI